MTRFFCIMKSIIVVCCILPIVACAELVNPHQEYRNEVTHVNREKCTLIVNGMNLSCSKYVSINEEQQYALLPLIPLCEAFGANISWCTADTAEIDIAGEKYYLNTSNSSLTTASSEFNWLMVSPGSKHGKTVDFIDNVYVVDSDSLTLFFSYIIGARITIDYRNSVITVWKYDILLSMLLMPAIAENAVEEYVIKGLYTNGVETYTGIKAYLPDGLTIYPLVPLSATDDPLTIIPIRIEGMDEMNGVDLNVFRCDIQMKTEYTGIFDFPTARIHQRIPVYRCLQEYDRNVMYTLVDGDRVTVYAHIGHYYFVKYQGMYNFHYWLLNYIHLSASSNKIQ